MRVNSFNPEFGYELISVLPYAGYWSQRKKVTVISGYDMQPFYWFCNYEYDPTPRSWYNVAKMTTPNRDIHKPELNKSEFYIPDFKKKYSGKYDFDVVVCNRKNNEWPATINKPLNFFCEDMLFNIFSLLEGKKIAYLNIDAADQRYWDGVEPIRMKDYDICKEFGVSHIKDLAEDSFNLTQLQVMASADMYITMNGGYGIMASLFGGKNIIYTNPQNGVPRENYTGDFNYYKDFAGSEVINATSYSDLINELL